MMKKFCVYIQIIIFVFLFFSFNAFSYGEEEHNKIFKSIFIGNNLICAKNGTKNLTVLDNASYLAIDQFHGNNGYEKGKKILAELKKIHIKNLPRNIDEIDFTDNSGKHRRYTHRGWNYEYTEGEGDKANWKKRKKILVSSVQKVFKVDEKKADFIAEFIYYIHILGDHKYDLQQGNFYTQNMQIELGGRKDKKDIVNGILRIMPLIFNQENSPEKYRNLKIELERINKELMPYYETSKLSIQENKNQYQSYVNDIIEVLKVYVPALLKKEVYFEKAFY